MQNTAAGRLVLGRSRSRPTCETVLGRLTSAEGYGFDLLGWVVDEADTGFDVGLETFDALLEELLLIVVCAAEDIDGFLSSVGL